MRAVLLLASAAVATCTAAAPTIAAVVKDPPPRKVTILQVNDVYQQAPVDNGTRGGLARVATTRKQVLEKDPTAIFLLAGDTLSPSIASREFKGKQMIEAWNALGVNFAVLGNHEFDFGPDVLMQRIADSKFEWICANVVDKRTGKQFGGLKPYTITEVNGVRLGLIGLLTPDTIRSSQVGPNVEIKDPCQTVRKYVPEMRARGAQVVIGLTHLNMSEDKKICECAPLDLIVGGHEHVPLNAVAHGTPIVKSGSDARNLGHIELWFAPRQKRVSDIDWELIPITNQIPDDPKVHELVATSEAALEKELAAPVVQTSVDLDTLQNDVRTVETNAGDMVADAFRKETLSDIAIVNGGSIRSNAVYPPGILTRKEIVSILPFENPVVKLLVPGRVVKDALENGVSQVGTKQSGGRFAQVSGLTFEYDASRPPGSRVLSVNVAGQPLNPEKRYTLATNGFVASGGDGYDMLQNERFLISPEEGQTEAMVLLNALSREKVISPGTDGRIKRLDEQH